MRRGRVLPHSTPLEASPPPFPGARSARRWRPRRARYRLRPARRPNIFNHSLCRGSVSCPPTGLVLLRRPDMFEEATSAQGARARASPFSLASVRADHQHLDPPGGRSSQTTRVGLRELDPVRACEGRQRICGPAHAATAALHGTQANATIALHLVTLPPSARARTPRFRATRVQSTHHARCPAGSALRGPCTRLRRFDLLRRSERRRPLCAGASAAGRRRTVPLPTRRLAYVSR